MNLRKSFNIVNRIASGYVFVIAIIFIISIFGIIILAKNNKNSDRIFKADMPVLSSFKDFKFLISESKKMTHSWIYLSNLSEKEGLKQIQTKTYPALKSNLLSVASRLNDEPEQKNIQGLISSFDSIIVVQQQIMGVLASDEDYGNDVKVDEAITLFEKQLIPKVDNLLKQLTDLSDQKSKALQEMFATQHDDNNMLSLLMKIMVLLVVIAAVVIFFLTKRIITAPLNRLKEVVLALGKGEIINIGAMKRRDSLLNGYKSDEIGQMEDAIDGLLQGVRNKASFADEIGKGNYEKEFQLLSDKDTMGIALIDMRDKLMKNKEEDDKRSWVTTGVAQFADLLRTEQDDIKELGDTIISKLVKYTNSNQGSLFIVNDENERDIFIEQLSCYAWDRKKYNQKRIEIGEGLVGQVVQEKEYIYITDVPDNYVQITSGLGDSNPRSILIIPMKLNEEIFGIIELASFHLFEQYQIEFVQKIGESIASTIKMAKVNFRTKKLLAESQSMTEELKSQEEEMRQNMEEMQATHEEMKRVQRETETQLNIINKAAIVSKTDLRGYITYVNDEFCRVAKYTKEELIGKNHNIIRHPDMPKEAFEDLWKTISSGKTWRGNVKNRSKDGSHYWVDATIAPVLGDNGKPIEYMAVRFLITEFMDMQEELKKLKKN